MLVTIAPQANAPPTGNVYGEELIGLPFLRPKTADVDSLGRIYVATWDTEPTNTRGVWRSDDRGLTWTQVATYSTGALYVDSRGYIYAQFGGGVIKRSFDNGTTWTTELSAGAVMSWARDSEGRIYFSEYGTYWNRPTYIYRSNTEGTSFTKWYNVTADRICRHVHSVAVDPYDWVWVTTGDQNATYPNVDTIRRWNKTTWEIVAESTSSSDFEPRWMTPFFIGDYVYGALDMGNYMYRFPRTGSWSQRARILRSDVFVDNEIWGVLQINDVGVFVSTDNGNIAATWDGIHWVKVFDDTSTDQNSAISSLSSRNYFPIYFVDNQHYKLYRINQMTREDLIRLYYRVYNTDKGLVLDQENYVLEQRLSKGTDYLDLTSVALSNVQASIKGLSKRNLLANSGFEYGNTIGWAFSLYGGTVSIESGEKYEGSYSLKVQKDSAQTGDTLVRPSTDFMVRKGDIAIVSFSWKGNDTIADSLSASIINQTADHTLVTRTFSSSTSWQKAEMIKTFNSVNPWTMRVQFSFKRVNLISWLDAVLITLPETAYQRYSTNDSIAYNPEFFNSTYFPDLQNTANPSITVADQTVSYSGSLSNGTESPPQSVTGILTGAVKVVTNIEGSEQAILRITGTRVLYEDSIILMARIQNVYYGRYYGDVSFATTTNDLITLTNLQANITSVFFDGYRFTLTINSPTGTTSTTLVYVGNRGMPWQVEGATSWSYDELSKMLITETNHLVPSVNISVKWKYPGDVNGDDRVNLTDLTKISKAYGTNSSDTGWDRGADLNNDGIIDLKDLSTLGKNYGNDYTFSLALRVFSIEESVETKKL